MRSMMTFLSILLLSFNAQANTEEQQKGAIEVEKSVGIVEILTAEERESDSQIALTQALKIPSEVVILYKMKENIIRRELSFIPRKKWRKWT